MIRNEKKRACFLLVSLVSVASFLFSDPFVFFSSTTKFCDGIELFFNRGRTRNNCVISPLILCSKYLSISLSRKCLLHILSPFVRGLLFRGITAAHSAISSGAYKHCNVRSIFLGSSTKLTEGRTNMFRELSKLQLLSQLAM